MDVIGSEIGLKMRSAIKAKLTELGCYVDDELPDYVMVMVANKRTRPQMEEDLHLFLASNTASFVAWLYQVLRKLQEVTITTPPAESRASSNERTRTRSTSKEPKGKDKKIKDKKNKIKEKHKNKKDVVKKSKKKSKEKVHRKKVEKKVHKHKKKPKDSELIRPNVPPLLMNPERESEPSITDVFAGQILKNHGENLAHSQDNLKEQETEMDVKPVMKEVKRAILPIIDPASISVTAAPAPASLPSPAPAPAVEPAPPSEPHEPPAAPVTTIEVDKEGEEPPQDKLQEINQIEEKIHDLRRKLAKQLSSMSDDEDFLNIRAGPEELLPELADDVFQELNAARSIDVRTPPLEKRLEAVAVASQESSSSCKENGKPADIEVTQIELCLPKRSVRERLGAREMPKNDSDSKKSEKKEHKRSSDKTKDKTRKSSSHNSVRETDSKRSKSSKKTSKDSKSSKNTLEKEASPEKHEPPHKRKSPGSVGGARAAPASVVSVRARRAPGGPRAPASQLLFRAVAEAQKSLLNIPPKIQTELSSKRAPARPCENPRLMILVSGAKDGRRVLHPRGAPLPALPPLHPARDDTEIRVKREKSSERVPAGATATAAAGAAGAVGPAEAAPLVTRFINTDYVPALLLGDAEPDAAADTAIVNRADIHNAKVASEEGPVFLVTLEGLDPNQFLSKKLQSEGIDGGPLISKAAKRRPNSVENHVTAKDPKTPDENSDKSDSSRGSDKKRLSDTSEESDTQVIIKPAEPLERIADETRRKIAEEKRRSADRTREKRRSAEKSSKQSSDEDVMIVKEIKTEKEESPPAKRRRARSPIVFDVGDRNERTAGRGADRLRARTVSNGSDSNTVVTTPASTKYNSLPSLPAAERKAAPACRSFPLCRFGPKCLFAHPPCKFAAACTRRNCMYSHHTPPTPPSPSLSPHSPPAHNPYIASHVVPAPNYKSITAKPATAATPSMCKYYPGCTNPSCHYYHPKPCRFGKACANRHDCNFYHHDAPGTKWRSAAPFEL